MRLEVRMCNYVTKQKSQHHLLYFNHSLSICLQNRYYYSYLIDKQPRLRKLNHSIVNKHLPSAFHLQALHKELWLRPRWHRWQVAKGAPKPSHVTSDLFHSIVTPQAEVSVAPRYQKSKGHGRKDYSVHFFSLYLCKVNIEFQCLLSTKTIQSSP